MTAARLVARCIRGAEAVLVGEILRNRTGAITHLGHREVHFSTDRSVPSALGLRTADDVFVSVGETCDIGRGRDALDRLTELVRRCDPTAALEYADQRERRGVEVSASFLGRRNYNRYDLEDRVGEALAERLNVPYHSRRDGVAPPPSCSAWRLTLDGTHSSLMLRLASRPLHRRAYKRASVPGTLHPPAAAAMVELADLRPGQRVVDPCCGAGTVLIEAAAREPDAHLHGYDVDPVAVRAARSNASDQGDISVHEGDAGRLPMADESVDRILTNPPWGGQVAARGSLAGSPKRLWSEVRRVLDPAGCAVVLVSDAAQLYDMLHCGLLPDSVEPWRLFGSGVYVVRLRPGRVRRDRTH